MDRLRQRYHQDQHHDVPWLCHLIFLFCLLLNQTAIFLSNKLPFNNCAALLFETIFKETTLPFEIQQTNKQGVTRGGVGGDHFPLLSCYYNVDRVCTGLHQKSIQSIHFKRGVGGVFLEVILTQVNLAMSCHCTDHRLVDGPQVCGHVKTWSSLWLSWQQALDTTKQHCERNICLRASERCSHPHQNTLADI